MFSLNEDCPCVFPKTENRFDGDPYYDYYFGLVVRLFAKVYMFSFYYEIPLTHIRFMFETSSSSL
ncbi:hypothetical protein DERP_011468 [Dermatophagoides pteronyssinus]|uniref:Uncharacterized protein n=1 Tax=Dermatophagoides pteronyssinus TaxID=6956 RepID=A0ABQ8J5A2_DERPT|nr:hypothetical protein DERP_011468 [Dermatophagoides pteronyssinus]